MPETETLSYVEAVADIQLMAPNAWNEWSRSNDPRDKGFAEGLDAALAVLDRVKKPSEPADLGPDHLVFTRYEIIRCKGRMFTVYALGPDLPQDRIVMSYIVHASAVQIFWLRADFRAKHPKTPPMALTAGIPHQTQMNIWMMML